MAEFEWQVDEDSPVHKIYRAPSVASQDDINDLRRTIAENTEQLQRVVDMLDALTKAQKYQFAAIQQTISQLADRVSLLSREAK